METQGGNPQKSIKFDENQAYTVQTAGTMDATLIP